MTASRIWEGLFIRALEILDAAGIPRDEWTFGGGTALALRYRHRESRDVDIFLTDAQYLVRATPRLNRTVAEIAPEYEEAATFLKLFFPEGEVDLIVAPHLTPDYFAMKRVAGKDVRVETPAEIILKKLFYRADTLKTRDVVDVAAVLRQGDKDLLHLAPDLLGSRLASLERRWSRLRELYPAEAVHLAITDDALRRSAPAIFEEFLGWLKTKPLPPGRSRGAG